MANGWGGRRAGAGAPKGNNNAIIHGDYCRPKVDIDCSNTRELRTVNAAILRIQFSLPDLVKSSPFEVREYLRLNGMSCWVTDKIIQTTRKQSRERVVLAESLRAAAKAKLAETKAELATAKARYNEAKSKQSQRF